MVAASVPMSMEPESSMVTETMMGRAAAFSALAASQAWSAALIWSGSWQVSRRKTSQPPSMSPRAVSR